MCPWDLLIDIAKQTLTGNCLLQNSNGTWVLEGEMLSLGMQVVLPACDPVNNLTSKTLLLILVTIPLDPLQTPSPGFRFLKIITGHPTFSFNFASGNPEQLIEFEYSTGYRRSSLPFSPLFFRVCTQKLHLFFRELFEQFWIDVIHIIIPASEDGMLSKVLIWRKCWTCFVTCLQAVAPFNLFRQEDWVNGTPVFLPESTSLTRCWYQISSHSVQCPQLRPLALKLFQWTGVGYQETSAIWEPLPVIVSVKDINKNMKICTSIAVVHPTYQMDFVVHEPVIPIGGTSCIRERKSLEMIGDHRRWPKCCRMMAQMFVCNPTYESTLQQCCTSSSCTSSRRRKNPGLLLNVSVIIIKVELIVFNMDQN